MVGRFDLISHDCVHFTVNLTKITQRPALLRRKSGATEQDTSKLRQPLAKEAMAVLAGVCMSVTDDVGVGVGDGQMAVHPLQVLDILVDPVSVSTEDYTPIAILRNVLVSVLKILADLESNSSVAPTDEC